MYRGDATIIRGGGAGLVGERASARQANCLTQLGPVTITTALRLASWHDRAEPLTESRAIRLPTAGRTRGFVRFWRGNPMAMINSNKGGRANYTFAPPGLGASPSPSPASFMPDSSTDNAQNLILADS